MQWGQGHRQTCKQCLVQVICCISGRRVVHMTLRGTQKPGNYRNSQVVGKTFIHASFTAAIHSALVLYCFWRYHGCSSKAMTHSTENNCVLGEVLGKEPPSSYSSWAFRCITLIISSFIKTHCTSTFLLSCQSVFSPHFPPQCICPRSRLSCLPCLCHSLLNVLSRLFLLNRKKLPGITINTLKKKNIFHKSTPLLPRNKMGTGRNSFLNREMFVLFSVTHTATA